MDTYATTMPLSPTFQNEIEEIDDESALFGINIHYVRGRKNEAGQCHSRGICELTISIDARLGNPGGLDGEIGKDRYGNVFMIIEKGSMITDEPVDITGFAEGPGTFFLSNNADIPSEVKTGLGLSAKYQFKTGNYQVTETAGTYVVNFGK